jgi:hypothetical protein
MMNNRLLPYRLELSVTKELIESLRKPPICRDERYSVVRGETLSGN